MQQYIDYIKNTGGTPKIEWFDDDFEPIGPMVRRELLAAGLVNELDGRLKLVEAPKPETAQEGGDDGN